MKSLLRGLPARCLLALLAGTMLLTLCGFSDAAVHEVAASGSISAAIRNAQPGDTIRIAPGTYPESLVITKEDLTIISAATSPAKGQAVLVNSPNGPALTDPYNTIWRGIAFRGGGNAKTIANLQNFGGRMEYCSFDSGETTPGRASVITSGRGVFHGTTFANQSDQAEGVQILSGNPTFTYCRFENLAGGAVLIKSGNAVFHNCLFVRNKHVVNALDTKTNVEMTNSVLFLNRAPALFIGAAKSSARLSHCIFTPAHDTGLGHFLPLGSLDTLGNVKLEKCEARSPRFVSLRRRGLLNLGIDDTRNIPLWNRISQEADKYGYPVTIAVHVLRLTDSHIRLLDKGLERGHEVASHGMTHAPFNLDGGLQLGYDKGSAYISIGEDNVLKLFIDDELQLEIPLGAPEDAGQEEMPTIGDVWDRLHAKINAKLTDAPYRDVPATFLIRIPHFDLNFNNFTPTLGLQTDQYMRYEIHVSREKLKAAIDFTAENDLLAIANPHATHSRFIVDETQKAGYTAARVGHTIDTFSPYADGFDPYRIYAQNIKNQISPSDVPANRTRETILQILDFLNDSGGAMALYSHDENEFNLNNWKVLLKALHEDNAAAPMKLADMAEKMKNEGKLSNGRYFLVPSADRSDYRPRPDSPLRGAGKPVGLTHDFEGKPVSVKAPNIGLYE